jgi:hypothetical protein
MSIRLTNDRRKEIRRLLIEGKFKDRKLAALKRRNEFAEKIYVAAFGEPMIRRMNRLPKGWLKITSTIGARLGGKDFYHDTKHEYRIPAPSNYQVASFDSRHPLTIEHEQIEADAAAMKTEESQLCSQIDAVLWSANTAKQLIEIWPEIKGFAEKILAMPTPVQLPAIKLDTLNLMLGLKKAS